MTIIDDNFLKTTLDSVFNKYKLEIENQGLKYSIGGTGSVVRKDLVEEGMHWAKVSVFEDPNKVPRSKSNLRGIYMGISKNVPEGKIELRYTGSTENPIQYYDEINIKAALEKAFNQILQP